MKEGTPYASGRSAKRHLSCFPAVLGDESLCIWCTRKENASSSFAYHDSEMLSGTPVCAGIFKAAMIAICCLTGRNSTPLYERRAGIFLSSPGARICTLTPPSFGNEQVIHQVGPAQQDLPDLSAEDSTPLGLGKQAPACQGHGPDGKGRAKWPQPDFSDAACRLACAEEQCFILG